MASSDPHGKRGTAKAIDARLFRGSNLRRSDHAREHTIPCRARHSQRAASDADRLAGSCRSQLNPRLGIQPGHTGSGAVAGSGGGRRTADCLPVQHVPPGSARFRLRRWPACLSFDVPPAARPKGRAQRCTALARRRPAHQQRPLDAATRTVRRGRGPRRVRSGAVLRGRSSGGRPRSRRNARLSAAPGRPPAANPRGHPKRRPGAATLSPTLERLPPRRARTAAAAGRTSVGADR